MRHRGRAHRWGFTCVSPAAPFDGRTVLVPATESAGNIYPLINELAHARLRANATVSPPKPVERTDASAR
jgi:hypothetical protein